MAGACTEPVRGPRGGTLSGRAVLIEHDQHIGTSTCGGGRCPACSALMTFSRATCGQWITGHGRLLPPVLYGTTAPQATHPTALPMSCTAARWNGDGSTTLRFASQRGRVARMARRLPRSSTQVFESVAMMSRSPLTA